LENRHLIGFKFGGSICFWDDDVLKQTDAVLKKYFDS